NLKIEQLKNAGINADHVAFVTVDFQTESWSDKLKAAGYDPSKKTIFLWEGVTLYISEQDVRHTLRELKVNAPAGSVLVTDIYALSFVSGEYEPRMKPAYQALKITDEELGFGLDFSSDHHQSLKTFVESEGLKLGETYFMAEKLEKGSYMVVAEILIE
ncbi:MAG: class I SAM-dependent methyltransferase, partial [Chloroflexota bacterium]